MKNVTFACMCGLALNLIALEQANAQPPDNGDRVEWEEQWELPGDQIENTIRAWREVVRMNVDAHLADFSITYDKRSDGSTYITFYRAPSIVNDSKQKQVLVKDNSEIYGVLIDDDGVRITYTGDD